MFGVLAVCCGSLEPTSLVEIRLVSHLSDGLKPSQICAAVKEAHFRECLVRLLAGIRPQNFPVKMSHLSNRRSSYELRAGRKAALKRLNKIVST